MTKDKVLIGTSGWGYDEWVGPFYPRGLRKEDYLLYYSEIFYTNEINTTFYNIPPRSIVENWVNKTPDNFLFSAKIPQSVTHEHKLNVDLCLDDLDYFLRAMEPLIESKKLLSFLIQLPPYFKRDEHFDNLKQFINNWPGDHRKSDYFLVIEFRDKSWMNKEVFNYLEDNYLTYCAVIEPLLPPRMDVTNLALAYIRFHGFGKNIWFDYFFTEEEIKKWVQPMREVIQKSNKVGIYFNNHFSGYAAKNSLMLMKELGLKPRNSPEHVSILEIKKKSGALSKGQVGLDKFLK
ncbi:MAG: DUF72 domain-containing protein [Promethearchaeota archaeon]|nr:MAG: DUF72 domain-containing protein [Candidatus Lokiarchaeota archaeon]